ncbi:MAG: hypothetical protein ACO3Y3_00840 [Phycisphaerales bacterium]
MRSTGPSDAASPRSDATSSIPAIVGTLLAIAAAVLVGVLGPQLGDRGIAPSGVPLGAVVESLGELHDSGFAGDADELAWRREVEALAKARVPRIGPGSELEDWTFEGFRSGTLPGIASAGEMVVARFKRDRPEGVAHLTVAAVADRGALTRFDGFARSRPLQAGEVLEFAGNETAGGTEVLVVVDELVWIAHADPSDDDLLQGIRRALLGGDRQEPPDADRPIDG